KILFLPDASGAWWQKWGLNEEKIGNLSS
ncbi:MAG: hypothetical protein RUDDFDWM_001778, partial [Candidatus Fervidibacterota bacterium]